MSVPARGPLRALFVTYAMRSAPLFGPSMIGALKRCLRLIRHFPEHAVEAHWVHSGPLPAGDPLVREMAARVARYDLHGRRAPAPPPERDRLRRSVLHALLERPELALPRALAAHAWPRIYAWRGLRRLLRHLRPDVVVLADNPLAGTLRLASHAALARGIPQVGIDDYLGPLQPERLWRSSPQVTGWFLVGLPFGSASPAWDGRVAVAPPMLPPPEARDVTRVDLTILGYDPGIARRGLDFLARLGPGTTGRLVGPPLDDAGARACSRRAGGARLSFAPPPDEGQYRALLGASRVVFCKNGFQQIVEALALGVPAVTCDVAGGVPEIFMADELRPFVAFLPEAPSDWEPTVARARAWLAAPADVPWRDLAALDHPARHGARLLAELLTRVTSGAEVP